MKWSNVSTLEAVLDLWSIAVGVFVVYNLFDAVTDKMLVKKRKDSTWRQCNSAVDNLRNGICLAIAQAALTTIAIISSLIPSRPDEYAWVSYITIPCLLSLYVVIMVITLGEWRSRRKSKAEYDAEQERAKNYRRRRDDPPSDETTERRQHREG